MSASVIFLPLKSTLPDDGISAPDAMFSKVVLPQPLSPQTITSPFSGKATDTSDSAVLAPYVLDMFFSSSNFPLPSDAQTRLINKSIITYGQIRVNSFSRTGRIVCGQYARAGYAARAIRGREGR